MTDGQRHFLATVKRLTKEHKRFPRYRELANWYGYRSTNSVTQRLQALERFGFLRREKDGWKIVDENVCPHCGLPINEARDAANKR